MHFQWGRCSSCCWFWVHRSLSASLVGWARGRDVLEASGWPLYSQVVMTIQGWSVARAAHLWGINKMSRTKWRAFWGLDIGNLQRSPPTVVWRKPMLGFPLLTFMQSPFSFPPSFLSYPEDFFLQYLPWTCAYSSDSEWKTFTTMPFGSETYQSLKGIDGGHGQSPFSP